MLIIYTLSSEESAARNARIEHYLAALAEGDSNAVGGLYELIKTDIYAFALSKIGGGSDAEDLTHDTFVQVYKNAPLYRPMGKPLAWIFTIELNLIRRHVQKGRRTIALDETIEVEQSEEGFADEVIRSEFLRELMRVLSEEEREVIVLHIQSGLKHREIARLLDKPLSTVLSKYNRAIRKLQAIVKEGER